MSDFLYPLDTTGSALSNRVRGEFQTLSPPTQSDNFHFIIPKSGPYYRDTMKVRHVSTNRLLVRGIDWEAGHYFHSASYETESVKGGIYQSILFLDRSLSGQVHLEEYFVLGGEWSLNEDKILEILSNRLVDPRSVTYEQVSGKPEVFPPIEHMHPAGDLVGMREQTEATYQISAAIRDQTEELPGKLQLILQEYYKEGEIDELLLGLSEQLIGGIAGPQIEAMLRDVVASMITNYYTKSQVDGFIATVTQQINALYTNQQIDGFLATKADKSYVDEKLDEKVDLTTFESALENVTVGAIYQGDLEAAVSQLAQVDQNIQSQIDIINIALGSLGGDMTNYVTKDEFLSLVPDRDYDPRNYKPASLITYKEVPDPEDPDETIKSIDGFFINGEILSHQKENGKITSIEFMIHEGSEITISTGGYLGSEEFPTTVETLEIPHMDREGMDLAFLSAIYAFQITAGGDVVADEWTLNVDLTSRVGLLESTSWGEVSNIPLTDSRSILLGCFDLSGASPVWIPFVNRNGYVERFVETKTLSKSEALTGNPVKIVFPHTFGVNCNATVSKVKVVDSGGNHIPTLSVDHTFRSALINEVIVKLPKVDLSEYTGEPTISIDVEVTVSTLE